MVGSLLYVPTLNSNRYKPESEECPKNIHQNWPYILGHTHTQTKLKKADGGISLKQEKGHLFLWD